ncbi:patatin-like phospholipase family protein [Nocardioides dongxiaopingii]|uniref:patatin-like phospholipase family protein n=1 Tax=Nocardioides sp. S-1144 TaxID=2582905 RepID=UPI001C9E60EB|nr:hypothetical protein [Nocardioides sp. S-1144]
MTTRGLVLGGGGGITGIAWETGLLWGLAEAGVDLTDAERVVGTSAGSIVGAQVTSSTPLEELYRRQLLAPAELGDGGVPLASIGLGVVARWSRGSPGRCCARAATSSASAGCSAGPP